jgi:adenylate cyclase
MPDSAELLINQSIIQDMSEGVFTVGLNGKLMSINPAAEKILAIDKQELLESTFAAYFISQPENDEFCQVVVDAIYDASSSHSKIVSYFSGSTCKKIYIKTSFLKDQEKKIGIVVVLNDISELSELRDAVTAMEEIQRLNSKLEIRNKLLHETFGRYLSDEIVNSLLETPDGLSLGGKKRYITILMSDLRGFTLISEQMNVEDVVTMLNHYYSKMVEVIHKYSGTIIEFIGDAVLAIFGAPKEDAFHAGNAVASALEMQLSMEQVNAWNQEKGFPALEMGVGINSGDTIVGNIGSQKTMKYNVIGKHVNLCSRVETYTTGGQIMVSEYAYNEVHSPMHVVQTLRVEPKGIPEPISIYQIDAIGEPYNLSIETKAVPLQYIAKPITVDCYRIHDKQIESTPIKAILQALSNKEILVAAGKLTPFENIKVSLGTPETEVLAKVVEQPHGLLHRLNLQRLRQLHHVPDEDAKNFLIRFTTDASNFYTAALLQGGAVS